MEPNRLRIILLVAGLVLIAAIYFFGRPRRPDQGRRGRARPADAGATTSRREPTLQTADAADGPMPAGDPPGEDVTREVQAELELLERTLADDDGEPGQPSAAPARARKGRDAAATVASTLGTRPDTRFDRIVTLFVAARERQLLRGPDLVVAAEKAGLIYGHMGIFHRLVDGHPEHGPVFSVANMVKPGNFDLSAIEQLQTPGISFFMTLPTPVPALDGWDMMLPTAQRVAELLDAIVLDEERNALGRQRVAHIRDELRSYDRKQDALNQPAKW